MSDYNAGERRIINREQPPSTMPVFGIKWADGYVPIGFALGSLFLSAFIGLTGLPFFLFLGAGFLLGLLLVYLSPSSVPTGTWLGDLVRYTLRPARVYSASKDAPASERNDGGLKNKIGFEPDTRTEQYTGIKRAWVGANVVLRTDGRMEAALELDAPSMDFAQNVDWASTQETAKAGANNVLVKVPELKLYQTTEPFAIDERVRRLEQRLTDSDLQNSPVRHELVREYKDHRTQDLQDRGIQRIRTFLIVTIDAAETQSEYLGEPTWKEKLAHIPILGLLLPASWRGHIPASKHEQYATMAETLEERMNQIQNEIIKDMEGFSVRRLSTIELFALGVEFWNGRTHAKQEIEAVTREVPVSRAASDVPEADGRRESARESSVFADGGGGR